MTRLNADPAFRAKQLAAVVSMNADPVFREKQRISILEWFASAENKAAHISKLKKWAKTPEGQSFFKSRAQWLNSSPTAVEKQRSWANSEANIARIGSLLCDPSIREKWYRAIVDAKSLSYLPKEVRDNLNDVERVLLSDPDIRKEFITAMAEATSQNDALKDAEEQFDRATR